MWIYNVSDKLPYMDVREVPIPSFTVINSFFVK